MNNYKISHYANDTGLFQKGDRLTSEETIKTLNNYGKYLGFNLKSGKTTAVWLGNN